MDEDMPLGPPIRPEPEPVDLDAYKPIPGRPGWFVNGRGQMMRQGQIPAPRIPYPWYGMPKP